MLERIGSHDTVVEGWGSRPTGTRTLLTSNCMTQLSHTGQCSARGGLKSSHMVQCFNVVCRPLANTVCTSGGSRRWRYPSFRRVNLSTRGMIPGSDNAVIHSSTSDHTAKTIIIIVEAGLSSSVFTHSLLR